MRQSFFYVYLSLAYIFLIWFVPKCLVGYGKSSRLMKGPYIRYILRVIDEVGVVIFSVPCLSGIRHLIRPTPFIKWNLK